MAVPRITIGIPNTGTIRVETFTSLMNLINSTPGCQFSVESITGSLIFKAREIIADKAIREGVSHLFFVDTDMTFPPNALVSLLEADKPVIGASYNLKIRPPTTVMKFLDGVKQMEQPSAPFKVRSVGGGFMLIKVPVLKAVPQPRFWHEIKDNQLVGEDVWFCDRAKEAGFDVWCDPRIEVGHVGTFVY